MFLVLFLFSELSEEFVFTEYEYRTSTVRVHNSSVATVRPSIFFWGGGLYLLLLPSVKIDNCTMPPKIQIASTGAVVGRVSQP